MQRSRKRGTGAAPANLERVFGRVLKEIRKERGLSQEELGFDSGYHRTYISLVERGLMSPSLRTIVNIAIAFKMPAWQMLQRVEGAITKGRKHGKQDDNG